MEKMIYDIATSSERGWSANNAKPRITDAMTAGLSVNLMKASKCFLMIAPIAKKR